ncbi:MAG TPA: cyclophane-forming radical SAM/SPASM peptide maturase GrrM/OscB [Chitinophagaceae bacterium]|nr:cyclophane-forming radical SAM/SPASM peptide maturase GrrM/OscB [Chitinophagaceae bacterium]
MNIPVGPIDLLIIQGSPFCNIDCKYCYLPNRQSTKKISLDTVEKAVRNVFADRLVKKEFSIVWHAGEPMALNIEFYRQVLEMLDKIVPQGYKVNQHIQTNATLINQEWCDFFRHSNMIVGVSVDGPQFIHDANRLTRSGKGTFEKVMRGINLLKENNIEFSAIAVITALSLNYPVEIYNFFKELGPRSVGFNIDEEDGANQKSTIQSEQEQKLRNFWSTVYELQLQKDNYVHIREIFGFNEMLLKSDFGKHHNPFGQMVTPLRIITIDTDGNFTTFSPELIGMKDENYIDFNLGNVHTHSYRDALQSDKFNKMFREIMTGIKMCSETCDYFKMCGGGAPSNKLYENKSFASTETRYCKYSRQIIVDSILEKMEESLTN